MKVEILRTKRICSLNVIDVRVAHEVLVHNTYSLLQFETFDLDCYFTDVICQLSRALGSCHGFSPGWQVGHFSLLTHRVPLA